jgi:hypothetical protein
MRDAGDVTLQFAATPPAWPANAPLNLVAWDALRSLLIAFYDIGLGEGLPFDSVGTPTRTNGVNRDTFIAAFRNESSKWVCVLMSGASGRVAGGPLDCQEAFPKLVRDSGQPITNLLSLQFHCVQGPETGIESWATAAFFRMVPPLLSASAEFGYAFKTFRKMDGIRSYVLWPISTRTCGQYSTTPSCSHCGGSARTAARILG